MRKSRSRRELDGRVAEARARAVTARAEAAESAQRYDTIQAKVVEPLTAAGAAGFSGTVRGILPAGEDSGHDWVDRALCIQDGTLPDLLRDGTDSLWQLCLSCPVAGACVNWHCMRLNETRRNGTG